MAYQGVEIRTSQTGLTHTAIWLGAPPLSATALTIHGALMNLANQLETKAKLEANAGLPRPND